MAHYKPKYRQTGTRPMGIGRRLVSAVSSRLQRKGAVRHQAAVVDQQRKRQVRKLSRKGAVVALVAVLLSAAGWYCYQVLDRSDIFRLAKVTVNGNRMTGQEQILELGCIEQGVSLLSFDVGRAEERINSHQWIDRVKISRSWPSTLIIRVYEHKPLAMVNMEGGPGQGLYYVDYQGDIFAEVDSSHDLDFPVITGIQSDQGVLGTSLREKGLASEALTFLRLADKGNPIVPLQTISEIHLAGEEGLVVYLVDRPFPIYMGYDNIKSGYYRLVQLLEQLYRKEKIHDIKEIRMRYQDGRILVARMEP